MPRGPRPSTRRNEARLSARELTARDFVDVVAHLHGDGVARETIRKTLGAAAMALDHAGITPNPARDRSIKLPREEPDEINPPTADHVAAVYRLLPSKHRLPLLWLDWSGARVSSDRPHPRRRLRRAAPPRPAARGDDQDPQGALGRAAPVLADALERRLGPREDRDPDARLFAGSGADALRTVDREGVQGGRRPALVAARPAPPPDLAAAPARRAVGADRRVRRPARPHRDREHLHARPRRRGRARLREAARMSPNGAVPVLYRRRKPAVCRPLRVQPGE